jgi:uncharacterized membrane protein HdeD (DUF308 family)
MAATGSILVVSIICAIAALISGIAIRIAMFWYSNERTLQWHDQTSQFCGVIAGILLGFYFVVFIFKVHKDCKERDEKKDSPEGRLKKVV